MTFAQKAFASLAGIALVTSLILPQRQTAAVLKAGSDGLAKLFGTVMGTK